MTSPLPSLPINEFLCGDSSILLRSFPTNSVDLIATDPPYGLDFMGRNWDKAVPSVGIWEECLRVLKPGAFAFIMSSPRLDCLGEMSRRLYDAGLDVGFTPIFWAYASGFPKPMNIGRMMDKMKRGHPHGTADPESAMHGKWKSGSTPKPIRSSGGKAFENAYIGFQPKPAVEVILVCMKPLSERTYVEQVMKNRHGITWLGDVRVPFQTRDDERRAFSNSTAHRSKEYWMTGKEAIYRGGYGLLQGRFSRKGRFPANLIVSDDALDDGKVHAKGGSIENAGPRENKVYGVDKRPRGDWESYGDAGSFSRYFDLDRWFGERLKELPANVQRTFPFLICPKATRSEREKGLGTLPKRRKYYDDGRWNSLDIFSGRIGDTHWKAKNPARPVANVHPTVKPLKLMSYLVMLGSREDDVVLDPFAGTGTTCIAAHMLNRKWIGIEIEPEYMKIAQARLKAHVRQARLA